VKEELKVALADARSLWFLCSGNVVRSAFAEVYARKRGCPIPVHSAATLYRNDAMFPETVRELTARGIGRVSIERFVPVHLDDIVKDVRANDVIFGMTQEHIDACLHHMDTPRGLSERVFLLGDAQWVTQEILDPVLDGADFSRTFDTIAKAVEGIVLELKGMRQTVR
jgi:protein-tyrosine-phosphatase